VLAKVGFEGFQSFGLSQEIDLAPLTLIFGPNSSGKSSVGRLLRLFAQSPSGGTGLVFSGGDVDLGSLASTAFRNDTKEGFTSKFFVIPLSRGVMVDKKTKRWIYVNAVNYETFFADFDEGPVEIVRVGFALYESREATAKRGDLEIVFAGVGDKFRLTRFSARGLRWLFEDVFGAGGLDSSPDIDFSPANSFPTEASDEQMSSNERVTFAFWDEDLQELRHAPAAEHLGKAEFYKTWGSIGMGRHERDGFIPKPNLAGSGPKDGFSAFLLDLLRKADRELARHLGAFQYVGPLREITNGYVPRPSSVKKIRGDGSNLQQYLAAVSDESFDRIANDLELLTDGNFSLRKKQIPFDVFEIGGQLQTVVFDNNSETDVTFGNSGAGLAQVLPIIAGIRGMSGLEFMEDEEHETARKPPKGHFAGTLFIEQPELHLHPRMQTNLVDFLLENTGTNGASVSRGEMPTVICETHSESFLLRVQKRIRDGDYPPSKVAFYFVDRLPGSNSSYIDRMEINDDGYFSRAWPLSFSELRNRER